MMSSSKVIKPSIGQRRGDDILTASHDGEQVGSSFQTLDSLWRDEDGHVASIAGIQEQKQILQNEAEKIVLEAAGRAAQIEKEAFEKGFAEGKAEGQKEITAKVQEVARVLVEIQKERQLLYSKYEEDVLGLIKMMVDKIVDHEVSVNPRVISACLKKTLSYVIENSRVKIHLNGVDFNRIKEASMERPEILEGFNQLELIEDQSISQGGCLLETEFGEVDATIDNRKEKLLGAIDRFFIQSLSDG